MMLFRNLKIRTKIILVLTTVAVLAVGINGYIGYESAAKSLEVESFNKLTAIRELKASQIEEYFNHISNQLVSFSNVIINVFVVVCASSLLVIIADAFVDFKYFANFLS